MGFRQASAACSAVPATVRGLPQASSGRVAQNWQRATPSAADYLDQVLGGDEATNLITFADLRLFSYSHQRRCCHLPQLCPFQLQPLVEPQPSQT
jgi:hypothetical protein